MTEPTARTDATSGPGATVIPLRPAPKNAADDAYQLWRQHMQPCPQCNNAQPNCDRGRRLWRTYMDAYTQGRPS